MIFQIFKLEKTRFLNEEIFNENEGIIQKFFDHCPGVEYVLGLLKIK